MKTRQQIVMQYYNKLRQTNRLLAKTKEGRSMIMREAVFSSRVIPAMTVVNNAAKATFNYLNVLTSRTPLPLCYYK